MVATSEADGRQGKSFSGGRRKYTIVRSQFVGDKKKDYKFWLETKTCFQKPIVFTSVKVTCHTLLCEL